ncbi:MAG: hypothetical protein KY445_06110, partial [Armatimonadetes bacterium]|nr:hypothetical protein [Armatimonadota bacterium]
CDNALLLRDLRVYSRFLSVHGYALRTVLLVLATPLVLAALSVYLGARGRFLVTSMGAVFFQIALQVFIMMWGAPTLQWHKERTGQTLPLLLITPLTSREILLGRLLAVPVYYWVGLSPVLLILLTSVAWAMWQGYWVVAPLAIAIAPLFLSFGVWLCCSPAVANPFSARVFIGDVFTILLRLLQSILLVGCVWLGIEGFDARPPYFGSIDPLLGWAVGILLGLGNAALCWVWFRLRVRQLDALRQGDMEVPDSKELAPPTRRRAWKLSKS